MPGHRFGRDERSALGSEFYRARAALCCWSALSIVIAIQAGPERPCFLAVLLTASTISGVSGTLTITSKPPQLTIQLQQSENALCVLLGVPPQSLGMVL